MLYDRWRQIARHNGQAAALWDLATGRRWTFGQLAKEAESFPAATERVVYPHGICPEFILTVLHGWRGGRIVCPLETGQAPPPFSSWPPQAAHLKTTSASTGVPRVIAFTAEQLFADAQNIVETMGLRPAWPNLGVISLAHSYGFSSLVLPLLLHGIPLYLIPSPLPESIRGALKNVGPATLPAVPALWRAWLDANAISSQIQLAISAGAPLPLAVEQSIFERIGLKLHNFYGASECGGIAYDSSALPRSDPACAGSPLRNVWLSVGSDGCLEVRSSAVGQAYWPEPKGRLQPGCFQTTDLAEIRDGVVYLLGRASDQINVAGRKVFPEMIERLLLSHPEVKDCLVFGAPSPAAERSEIIVACIAAPGAPSPETLRQFLSERLPAWQIPREWIFVQRLAANQRGKLSRAEWRRRFLENRHE